MTDKEIKKNDRLLTTLGLCARAGALIYGVESICMALRKKVQKKTPILVIEASDTSNNTHKKLSDKCRFYGTEHIVISYDMTQLGVALGRQGPLAAVGITDPQLCVAIKKQLGNVQDHA